MLKINEDELRFVKEGHCSQGYLEPLQPRVTKEQSHGPGKAWSSIASVDSRVPPSNEAQSLTAWPMLWAWERGLCGASISKAGKALRPTPMFF